MKFVSVNKDSAHTLVGRAIRDGKLIPSEICEDCGCKPGKGKDGRNLIQAHHYKGYEKEFIYDVKWLCVRCHRKVHSTGIQATPWRHWENKPECPRGHSDNFGINNRGHRFCRTCANASRRVGGLKLNL